MPDDLGACHPEMHSSCTDNPSMVQLVQRTTLLGLLEDSYGQHGSDGYDTFAAWPHALSRTHQQMHLKWLKRAHEGGLRLMIASVTDNELLSKYYHDDHRADGVFQPEPGAAFESAKIQLGFIEDIAAANSEWMGIARDADEAQTLLDDDKLVLLLGVELDNLSLDEIITLVQEDGVRSVIPIHLADNEFGGTAVYTDLFNTLNFWLNGRFYSVVGDESLTMRLGVPEELREEWAHVGWAIRPAAIDSEVYRELGYECFGPDRDKCVAPGLGHRNELGLADPAKMEKLMSFGILLDVAHMSWQSTEETIALAEEHGFPLINSHTGLRDETVRADSERAMTFCHARRIARLGGLIGMGTEGRPGERYLVGGAGGPLVRLTGDAKRWRTYLRADDERTLDDQVHGLRLRIGTGGDDLRGSEGLCQAPKARLLMTVSGESFVLDGDLSRGNVWANNSVKEVPVSLEAAGGPVELGTIEGFEIELVQGSGCINPDNWNIDHFVVEYDGLTTAGTPTSGLLAERIGAPYRRLTEEDPSFALTMEPTVQRREEFRFAVVKKLDFLFVTGGDDLQGGTGGNLSIVLHLKDGRRIPKNVRALDATNGSFLNDHSFGGTWNFTEEQGLIRYGDIAMITLELPGGAEIDYDNWNLDKLKVTWSGCMGGPDCEIEVANVPLVNHETVAELSGQPTWRFTLQRRSAAVWTGLRGQFAPTEEIDVLRFAARTGGDDLRQGSHAELVLGIRDGTERSFPLNEGALWNNDTTNRVPPILLRPALRPAELDWVEVRTDFAGGVGGDNWNLDRFTLEALSDPATNWLEDFRTIFGALSEGTDGEVAIAIGSDLNGLQPQVPFVMPPEIVDRDPATLSRLPPEFAIARGDTSGGRRFTIEQDGIAHIGMLPDFVDVIQGFGDPRTDVLLDSAQATIDTLRRAEAAAIGSGQVLDPVHLECP